MAVSGIGTAYNILYDYQSRTQGTEQENKQSERFSDALSADGKTVPYGAMAKDGIIEYKGVIFTCDYENNRICLGDVSDKNKCINIALSGGGSLVVNRENLGDLSRAIGMFSPEDVNLILRALARDKQIQKMQHEIDDMENGEEAQQVIREKMQEIYKKVTKGETEEKFQIGGQSYSKKEWEKLEKNLGGIKEMKKLPDAIFIVDPKKERICVQEAHTLGIPLIGICDTNCDPEELDYVIPGNDDAIRAVKLIVAKMADAVIEANQGEAAEVEAAEAEENVEA